MIFCERILLYRLLETSQSYQESACAHLFRLGVADPKNGAVRVDLVHGLDLLLDLVQLVLGVDPETEDVPAAHLATVDNERLAKLGIA